MSSWLLDVADLTPFAVIDDVKASAMIDDASAMAALVAPCLEPDQVGLLSETQQAAVRAIIRGAILRWNEAGTGALTQQTAGPFSQSVDNRQQRKAMFWPSEIEQLQKICQGTVKSGAFQIDTAPAVVSVGGWCETGFDSIPNGA